MVVVFKIGDRSLPTALRNEALTDLRKVYSTNSTVLVHGGGDTVTKIAEQLGVPQKFVVSPEGFRSRLTDEETIQVYTMVMGGKINKEIARRLLEAHIPAVGLSGLDGGILQAERKAKLTVQNDDGRKRLIDGGYTGKIIKVQDSLLRLLVAEKYLPVIAPIAIGKQFEPLNVDGDRAAARIAGALQAERLVLLTDVDRVSIDGQPVDDMTSLEAKEYLPKIGPGMKTKVYASLEALSFGVKTVVIAPVMNTDPFSDPIESSSGTVIHE